MTQLLADPAHWRLRAQEARQRAKQLDDPEAKALRNKMADQYEDLAARAEAGIFGRLRTFVFRFRR